MSWFERKPEVIVHRLEPDPELQARMQNLESAVISLSFSIVIVAVAVGVLKWQLLKTSTHTSL
jgi:hypothetical protein